MRHANIHNFMVVDDFQFLQDLEITLNFSFIFYRKIWFAK